MICFSIQTSNILIRSLSQESLESGYGSSELGIEGSIFKKKEGRQEKKNKKEKKRKYVDKKEKEEEKETEKEKKHIFIRNKIEIRVNWEEKKYEKIKIKIN